jgi:hypothetical protein
MSDDMVARLAVKWWECSPPTQRTRGHLRGIVNHYADVYAIPAERWEAIGDAAWQLIPAWKKGE